MLGFVEIAVHATGCKQGSIKVISPTMIGADQLGCCAIANGANHRPAVAAAVVKSADRAVPIPSYDHRPFAHHHRHIAACFWQFAFQANHQPAFGKNRRHIKIEAIWFGIQSLRQSVLFTTLFKKRGYVVQIHD